VTSASMARDDKARQDALMVKVPSSALWLSRAMWKVVVVSLGDELRGRAEVVLPLRSDESG
jgi:hypothetical protein